MKTLNTLWVWTTNAVTFGFFGAMLYIMLGGVITAGQEPTPTCVTYDQTTTCYVR